MALWIAGAALPGAAPVAHGQTFACAQDTMGQLSVQAGVRCKCAQVPEGGITGAGAGYAWDCGVLQGRMNQLIPAAPGTYPTPPIDAVVVEKNDRPAGPSKPWQVPDYRQD
jgi:hypothetical protein